MTFTGTQTLTTDRLILRRFSPDDAQPMFDNWANDTEVTRFLTWKPHGSIHVTESILQDWISRYDNPGYYQWAIVPADGKNEPIGSIGVNEIRKETKTAHIGYCLGRHFWHQGIMSEAFSAVIDFLFSSTELNRVESMHDPNNPNSGKVMEKCGLSYEGTLRSFDINNQGICDAAWYGLLREEWLCRKELEIFLRLPLSFDHFPPLPELSDGAFKLVCTNKYPADAQKGWVPYYHFDICLRSEIIGYLDLRLGYDENLFFSGNIGYAIEEPFRGHGYAGRACRLAVPAAKIHRMKCLSITNHPSNDASRRVCEKLGARFIGKAPLPKWHSMYSETRRFSNIFLWDIENL